MVRPVRAGATTTNINAAVTRENLARALGLAEILSQPGCYTCPLCLTGVVRVLAEPYTGGLWWTCSGCELSASSIQFYQRVRGLSSTREAWMTLFGAMGVVIGPELISEQAVQNYLAADTRFNNLRQVMPTMARHLAHTQPPVAMNLMADYDLGGGYTIDGLQKGVGQFLGSINPEVSSLLKGASYVGDLRKACGGLSMAYEGLPGIPASLVVLTRHEVRHITIENRQPDGGLLGLSAACQYQSEVVALGDPVLWLRIQRRWLKDHPTPLTMVAYANPAHKLSPRVLTTAGWDSLPHKRIVLARADDDELPLQLDYARRFKDRAWLAASPECATKDPLDSVTPAQFVSHWIRRARPWAEVLRDTLLNLAPPDAQNFVARFSSPLDHQDLEALKSVSTENQMTRIRQLLALEQRPLTFKYRDRMFVERPGLGWYRVNARGHRPLAEAETMVSDATFRVNQITLIGDDPYMSGEITIGQTVVPFTERESELRQRSCSWITRACLKAGVTLPNIQRNFRPHVIDMAMAISKPAVATAIDRAGYDRDRRCWTFPMFRVEGGKVIATEGPISQVRTIPGYGIPAVTSCPTVSQVEKWIADDPGVTTAFAVYAAVVANVVAPSRGLATQGIGLVNGSDLGERVISSLGSALGLHQFNLSRRNVDKYRKLEEQEHKHDLPVVLQATATGLDGWWSDYAWLHSQRNMLMAMRPEDVVQAVAQGGWSVVRCDNTGYQDPEELMSGLAGLLPVYLSAVQGREISGLDQSPAAAVVVSLFNYLAGVADLPGLEAACDRVMARVYTTPTNLVGRFLWTVFNLAVDQDEPVYTPGGDGVEVHLDRVLKLLTERKVHAFDHVVLTDELAKLQGAQLTTAGVQLPKAVWGPEYKRWSRALAGVE